MTGDERIESLKVKHSKLEHLIDKEAHRPMPDDVHLAQLKRQKLRLKDEITRRSKPH